MNAKEAMLSPQLLAAFHVYADNQSRSSHLLFLEQKIAHDILEKYEAS